MMIRNAASQKVGIKVYPIFNNKNRFNIPKGIVRQKKHKETVLKRATTIPHLRKVLCGRIVVRCWALV